jgi:hypothetical protein
MRVADGAVNGDERLAGGEVAVERRVENQGIVGRDADDVTALAHSWAGHDDESGAREWRARPCPPSDADHRGGLRLA